MMKNPLTWIALSLALAMFARTGAFLSPRVSGLGRVLHEAKEAH